MKRSIICFIIGGCIGFCVANYKFDAQRIYETGVLDGYAHQRASVLFVTNEAYQRGYEDCLQATHHKKKATKLASR